MVQLLGAGQHWLDGLVESPIVTWGEFVSVQERLRLNQLYAGRNAKNEYLLRGLIQCQPCFSNGMDRHYYGIQRPKRPPMYVCPVSRWHNYGKECFSKPLPCTEVEADVKETIRIFLETPGVYLTQAKERMGIAERTIEGLEQNIRDLEKDYRKTIEDERRALSLLSDEAFPQEQALLKTKRKWIEEEIQRLKEKLENTQRFAVDSETIEAMRNRLGRNLDRATDEDWRVILEALDTKALAFGDGTWDIEINIPIPTELIENKTP